MNFDCPNSGGCQFQSARQQCAWFSPVVVMRSAWLLHLTLLKHLVWAWLLLTAPAEVGGITSLKIPITLFGGAFPAGLIYAGVSIWLVGAMVIGGPDPARPRLYFANLLGAVAQQFLLMVSAIGSVLAIWQGAYLDGTKVPRAHLVGDQDVYILLALIHPLAVLHIFAPDFWEKVRVKLWTVTNLSR